METKLRSEWGRVGPNALTSHDQKRLGSAISNRTAKGLSYRSYLGRTDVRHGTLIFTLYLKHARHLLLGQSAHVSSSIYASDSLLAGIFRPAMATKTLTAVVFASLEGSWRLRRQLQSALPGFPSGLFEGTATFAPRKPSAHSVAGELLYHEQGELRTENNLTLRANRKYIYRYNSESDKISVWFVKERTKSQEGGEEVDYLFHDIEMAYAGERGWTGEGEHLCELDMYWAMYEFRLPKIVEESERCNVFGVRYKVKGPQKDYTTSTAYERTFAAQLPAR